jgi:hypothetical protein
MDKDEIYKVFVTVAEENIPYLSQWYMDKPAVVSDDRYDELKRLQGLLYRAICYFVDNYRDFEPVFCLPDNVKKIIEICQSHSYQSNKYRPGTYRPDFLFDTEGGLRVCEIGGRFPLNGYLTSGFSEIIGARRFVKEGEELKVRSEYKRFLKYLFEYWNFCSVNEHDTFTKGVDCVKNDKVARLPERIVVLKGKDRPCDIKYYVPLFERLKINVKVISPEKITEEISADPDILTKSAVINEFNQMEIEGLPEYVIKAIAGSNALNDLRTIFLIHDKRFWLCCVMKIFRTGFSTRRRGNF